MVVVLYNFFSEHVRFNKQELYRINAVNRRFKMIHLSNVSITSITIILYATEKVKFYKWMQYA